MRISVPLRTDLHAQGGRSSENLDSGKVLDQHFGVAVFTSCGEVVGSW